MVNSWQILFIVSLALVVLGCLGIVSYGSLIDGKNSYFFELLFSVLCSLAGLCLGCVVLARFGRSQAEQADRMAHIENVSSESQAKLQLAIQSMGIAVWEWDPNAKSMHWDHRMFQLYDDPSGIPPSDLMEWIDRIHPDDRSMAIRLAKESASTGLFSMRFRVIQRDGALRHLRLLGRMTYDNQAQPLRMNGITWDITEDVLAHEIIEQQRTKLLISARLASLGEMAGGIAHEVNNPLQIIVGHAGLMTTKIARGTATTEDIAAAFAKISSTAERIGRIVKGLRTVARDGDQDAFELADPQSLFSDALALCAEKMRHQEITIDMDLSALDGARIECRAVQISQVLLNLLTNAYHAVEIVEDKWLRIEANLSDNWIEISVSDSGLGVPRELRDKIFQPFFTTKDVGSGTGLGLSLSLSIARDHGGTIELDESSPHTKFVLRLPRSQSSIQRQSA